MKARNTNGLTTEMRYGEQQSLINAVAKSLGCVAFRPDYHGLDRDGNTVLLYFPEDAEHNLTVDKEPTHYNSRDEAKLFGCTDERYFYRPYFWSFENTDANGMLTLDFANRGRLDLRGSWGWSRHIEGSIKLAYYNKMQIRYVADCGGWLCVKEADDTFNDFNLKRLDAFTMAHERCFIGSINPRKAGDPIYTEYFVGGKINSFACQFAVPNEDKKLAELIEAWRNDDKLPKSVKDAEKITDRVEAIGGELFMWY